MTLAIIAAMSQNRAIGKNGKLPWQLSPDLKHFKALTLGHPIIMGRKTFESIGKPLPGRKNIVLSRNPAYAPPGTCVASDLDAALATDPESRCHFVIGGADLFAEALPRADWLYLTLISKDIPGDVFFPPLDFDRDWDITEKSPLATDAASGLCYQFVTAKRKR